MLQFCKRTINFEREGLMFKKNKYSSLLKKIAKNSRVCIYGSNNTAKEIYRQLKENRPDVKISFFIDSNSEGTIEDVPVYLAKDLASHLDEFDIAIAASYSSRFYMEFILKAFGVKNIILINKDLIVPDSPKNRPWDVEKSAKVFKTKQERDLYKFLVKLRADRKLYTPKIKEYHDKKYPNRISLYPFEHYFEFLNKDVIKTAIDGGACNGLHSLLFLQMLKNCQKVYSFEPCYDSFKKELFDTLIKRDPRIEIIQKGLWKETAQLTFREEIDFKAASAVVEKRPHVDRPYKIITIDAISIDEFVEQNKIEKIDFIKMDIENAEQEALKGAEKTILRDRPQLAISIYHSDAQFFEIPIYLKEFLTDYEFRLGHYRDAVGETVLYAIPKELCK